MPDINKALSRAFDQVGVLCKETMTGINFSEVFETLSIAEYIGKVRRGYFVDGFSGIQFVREKEFFGITVALKNPVDQITWLSALDPAQLYGKTIAHKENQRFLNVAGIAVAIKRGELVAVFERKGAILRIFDESVAFDVLANFATAFLNHRIYSELKRVVTKDYPKDQEDILKKTGWIKEMQDYVLYRS